MIYWFLLIEDITSVLSPSTFTDENLTEQFYGDIEATSPQDGGMMTRDDELNVSF